MPPAAAATDRERSARRTETAIGIALVLAVAAPLVAFTATQERPTERGHIVVTARFENLGGLVAGSAVRIGGIDVGRVLSVKLDTDNLIADVALAIDSELALPEDSVASVGSGGVFGDSFIDLLPGKSAVTLPPRGRLAKTVRVYSLEETVARVVMGSVQN
ncbi:MAG: MCE family protein [Alphaproteobacteria bacterium]|nr:MCE family protein [Alphaproteobacteria bacterium]